MNASTTSKNRGARKTRITVGAIAIGLLLLFMVLAIIHVISVDEWLIADVVVALVANLVLRTVGRRRKQQQ